MKTKLIMLVLVLVLVLATTVPVGAVGKSFCDQYPKAYQCLCNPKSINCPYFRRH
jgi:hypothetical protein